MLNTRPRLSVIIPVYNESPKMIMESLLSVRNQTFRDFEVLVIDDSDRLESQTACAEFCFGDPRFRYFRNQVRQGLVGSLNLGIEMAQGSLVARFDSDDIARLDRFMLQVQFLSQNPHVGVVGSDILILSEEGKVIGVRKYARSDVEIKRNMRFMNAMAHPTVMIRRELFSICGKYDPRYSLCEDLELWLRMISHRVCFANIPDSLVQYRFSPRKSYGLAYHFSLRLKYLSLGSFPHTCIALGVAVIASMLNRNLRARLFRASLKKPANSYEHT